MGQLLGTHGEFIGRAPMELIRHAALETAVREGLRRGEASAFDLTTGTGRELLAKAAPVRGLSGDVEMIVVVFHDLTEIRRTEKMRKDFIANVSHEFKTPLTSIRGYAETLLNAPPEAPELSQDFLEAIERNAALLQALVEDLLILARLESEAPVHKTPLNIRALIEEQVDSRDQLINDKKVEVTVQCPDIDILADQSRLTRTISNLLDNAIHYNRPGGQIRISGKGEPRGFTLDIADTGIGIRQEDQLRIFERFYRVDKSRSRESGGTGLGLAIAKHAIESQGGTISVASRLGAGSRFTIFLPNSH
jgi:two-component system phosphate regulon sensor histidine kinase PhoR